MTVTEIDIDELPNARGLAAPGRRLLRGTLIFVASIGWACERPPDYEFPDSRAAIEAVPALAEVLPEWLPTSSTRFFASFRESDGAMIARIEGVSPRSWSVPRQCVQINARTPKRPQISKPWWPSDVPASSFSTHRHSFFRCGTEESQFLAVLPDFSEVLYWTIPAG